MNMGKMQMKVVTMATSHGPPSPGTCHTDLSVENKNTKTTYLNAGPSRYQEAGGRGQTDDKKRQSYSKQTTRANIHGDDSNAHAQGDYHLANRKSPS